MANLILTKRQLDKIINIIRKNITVFIGQQVGFDTLPLVDLAFLKAMKIDISAFKNLSKIQQAYYFGMISKALGKKETENMSFKQFEKFFDEHQQTPLSTVEEGALKHLKQRAYNDLSGLGNKISNSFSNRILIANQKQRHSIKRLIKTKVTQAVKESKSQNWLASELRNASKDWARDFDRIADFLMHEAYDTGRAYAILEEFGPNAEVYKDVYLGACDHCIKAYLLDGIGSEARVFTVSELIANGNNIGRTAKEALPVVGPHHPYCRCTIAHKPKGNLWNALTLAFDIVPRNTQGIKRKSSIKVTITKT